MMKLTFCMTDRPIYSAGTYVPGHLLGTGGSNQRAQFIIEWSFRNVSLSHQQTGTLPGRERR